MPAFFTSEPDSRYPLLLASLEEGLLSDHQLSESPETRSGKHSLESLTGEAMTLVQRSLRLFSSFPDEW